MSNPKTDPSGSGLIRQDCGVVIIGPGRVGGLAGDGSRLAEPSPNLVVGIARDRAYGPVARFTQEAWRCTIPFIGPPGVSRAGRIRALLHGVSNP